MKEAGLDVGILGMMETCNGDPARRAGNEYLFQMLAETNLATFEELGVKKIVSARKLPHARKGTRRSAARTLKSCITAS